MMAKVAGLWLKIIHVQNLTDSPPILLNQALAILGFSPTGFSSLTYKP
jgi:hypothetical protein